ncbi:hypothetical protein N7533_012557 [Penicillium manginii]|uniref:uncharacterized protein n=1 Tax=Penicillium manginii TaxID=203109 RepID=UPI0025482930|nr:uncharacterized protein N7533_012557 [Penicillium manginii]KAJ5739773.1 hypothetical protein N7533_012557 [Penicillium manginii]
MKLSQLTVAFAALLSTAVAQIDDLPNCAKDCLTGAFPANCGADIKCVCTTASFLNDIACCMVGKCNEEEQQKTLGIANTVCAKGGVTDLPASIACSSGASTSVSTSASTESKTSTATETVLTAATSKDTTTKESTATDSKTSAPSTNHSESASSTASSSETKSTASSTASSSSAAQTLNAAVLGQVKDTSLVAAAGAAAALAFFA